MSTIAPGTYKAKIEDYGLSETKKGDPMAVVRFSFNDGISNSKCNWTGTFGSDEAKERTLGTLLLLGLKDDGLENLRDGPESKMLDQTIEVEIVVELEEYEGKKIPKVKYVNAGGGVRNAMNKETARQKFVGMNIKADLARLRYERSAQKPTANAEAKPPIPF